MLHVFKCPSCGHVLRIPEDRLGKQARCPACNDTFAASAGRSITRIEEKNEEPVDREPFFLKLGKRLGADKTVILEGAIGGAMGGIVVGMVVGTVYGALKEMANEDAGSTVTAVATGLGFGFILGFGAGTLIGVLLGMSGKIVNVVFRLNSKRAAILSGMLAGVTMAYILGERVWVPVGCVLGGLVAYVWSLISAWAERHLTETSGLHLESLDPESDHSQRMELTDLVVEKYPRQTPEKYINSRVRRSR